MGKNLVNLGNLKETLAIPDNHPSSFSSQSQPVYIKTAPIIPNSAPQPKFIPGVFMTPQ